MSVSATMRASPGVTLGPYRVLSPLGAGGMGEVYLAEDTRLSRKIALKRLTGRWLASADARKRLLREARAAARLNHPNIAGVHDVIEMDGEAYIVMEYVEGETLAERLREGPLPVFEALGIASQLADALTAAHAAGVVHCDLKPANVRVTSGGRAKVLDFGLARTVALEGAADSLDGQFSEAGQLVGTPAYMSPERLLGKTPDHRGDIYSLGVVLYEMLTGRRPFQGTDAIALGLAVLTEKAPAASTINPAVPPEVSAIVERAMAGSQAERYQTAEHLRAALQGADSAWGELPTGAAARPAPARRPGVRSRITEQLLTRVSRRRRVAYGVAALAILLVAGAWMSDRLPLRPAAAEAAVPIVAVLPLENLTGVAEDDGLCAGISEVLRSGLSKVQGLTVLSRGSTVFPDAGSRDARRLGGELGATYVIDGSLQRMGDEVSVTITLLRAGSDMVAWSDTFSGARANVFALQSRISEAVARRAPLPLTPSERRELARVPTSNQEAFAEFAQGRAFLERADVAGNVDLAARFFESATSRDPGFALAFAGLGEAYWARYEETKDPAWTERARQAVEEAVRLDPGQPLVKVSLATIHNGSGRSEQALDELDRALQIQPQLDEAYRVMGMSYSALGRRAEAIEAFRRAIEIRPNYWRHYSYLGRVHFDAGELEDAEAAYRRITELQPDNAWGYQMLGAVYQAGDDSERALEHYARANALEPNRFAYANIGTIHFSEGRYDAAVQAYTRALELAPTVPGLHRNLGDGLMHAGRPAEGRAAYLKAIELGGQQLGTNPRQPALVATLAYCHARLDQHEQAGQLAATAVALSPDDPRIRYTSAVVHVLAKRQEQGLAELRQAVQRGMSRATVKQDDNLASLRGLAEYEALVNEPAEGGS